MTADFEYISREGLPEKADFALIMDTEEMEPLILKGQRIYISCRESLKEMDIGLFWHEGRVWCRHWCEDYSGALLLMTADKSPETCLYLDKQQRQGCLCLGKVLL